MNFEVDQKLLFQSVPSNTTAVALLQPYTNRKYIISNIIVASVNTATAFSIYLNTNGTTYTSANALYYNTALAANTSALIALNIPIGIQNPMTIGVQTNSGSNTVFNFFGREYEAQSGL